MFTDDKAREMGRSILPSKKRKAHAEQHRLSRQRRRRDRQRLRDVDWSEDGWLDCEVDLLGEEYYQRRIRYHVRDRRDADKIAPVMRWAEKTATDKRREDRVSYVASLLPSNLIGWHAMTHIEFLESFQLEEPKYERFSAGKRRRRFALALRYVEAVELLSQLIDEGRLRALNSVILSGWKPSTWVVTTRKVSYTKQTPEERRLYFRLRSWNEYETIVYDGPPRTLQDVKDIDSFLADLSTREHSRERERMLGYLQQVYGYEPS